MFIVFSVSILFFWSFCHEKLSQVLFFFLFPNRIQMHFKSGKQWELWPHGFQMEQDVRIKRPTEESRQRNFIGKSKSSTEEDRLPERYLQPSLEHRIDVKWNLSPWWRCQTQRRLFWCFERAGIASHLSSVQWQKRSQGYKSRQEGRGGGRGEIK